MLLLPGSTFHVAAGVLLTVVFVAQSVSACSFIPDSVQERFEGSTAVFVGELVYRGELEEVDECIGRRQLRFAVRKSWKGVTQVDVEAVSLRGCLCPLEFQGEVGIEYVVFSSLDDEEQLLRVSALSPALTTERGQTLIEQFDCLFAELELTLETDGFDAPSVVQPCGVCGVQGLLTWLAVPVFLLGPGRRRSAWS